MFYAKIPKIFWFPSNSIFYTDFGANICPNLVNLLHTHTYIHIFQHTHSLAGRGRGRRKCALTMKLLFTYIRKHFPFWHTSCKFIQKFGKTKRKWTWKRTKLKQTLQLTLSIKYSNAAALTRVGIANLDCTTTSVVMHATYVYIFIWSTHTRIQALEYLCLPKVEGVTWLYGRGAHISHSKKSITAHIPTHTHTHT